MIAGVRQFKLINALGAEYDMTRPDALLHAPDGLGWGTERTVNRLGMTYIGINEKEIHQSPSGEMVFRTYEEYGRFLSFCQQGGLVLCYKPLETWYYCECLISIQKSEIQWENNHLICPVQFTLLSYWYEKVVAQTAEPPEPVEPSYATVTGDPAVFTARYSYPIKDLSVAIQGSQELNGYDKPWVGGAGKNKLPSLKEGTYEAYGITITVDGEGVATMSGTANGTGSLIIPLNESITITQDMVDNSMYVQLHNSVANASIAPNFDSNSGVSAFAYALSPINRVALVPSSAVGKTIDRCRFWVVTDIVYSGTFAPSLEYSATQTAYEPYANICPITSYTSVTITQTGSQTNTYEVELTGAGNVYKGTLDVTSGELVVERAVLYVDPDYYSGFSSSVYGSNRRFVVPRSNIKYSGTTTFGLANTMPKNYMDVIGQPTNATENAYFPHSSGLMVTMVGFSDKASAEFKDWLREHPTYLAYELATPQTYQLTPTQMSNLIGSNTILADAGAVTVTYRTDARTEFKIYPYQYSYKYGDTAQNVFDITCDLPSYFKLTIFGEATNPSWRVVQNGSIVKSGKLNATIGSSQKLVINTDPKQTEIALYTLSNTRINNLYGYSDFATERIFALPQGESQVQVLTEDEQSPKVMIEVLKHV